MAYQFSNDAKNHMLNRGVLASNYSQSVLALQAKSAVDGGGTVSGGTVTTYAAAANGIKQLTNANVLINIAQGNTVASLRVMATDTALGNTGQIISYKNLAVPVDFTVSGIITITSATFTMSG